MGIFEHDGPPVPVTILGGFLGAGKTTLLNHLVRTSGLRLGVLVNDFGEIDLDSRLITESADGVVSLANGCVCCTIKGDVGRALMRLLQRTEVGGGDAKSARPEHIVLETSGISNPGAVVESFVDLARTGLVRVDGVVSVVDAVNFLGVERKKGSLAWCQVAAADLLVLSKTDVASAEVVTEVEREVRGIVPEVRVVRSEAGVVPAGVVLSSGVEVRSAKAHEAHHEHAHHEHVHHEHAHHEHAHHEHAHHEHAHHEHAHHEHVHHEHAAPHHDAPHGFVSFVVSAPAPFRWKALQPVLRALPREIYRVKGILSLEERPGDHLEVHVVGKRLDIRTIGPAKSAQSDLVIIGSAGFDRAELEARIRACLV